MTLGIKQGKGLFLLGASIMMVIVFAMVFWDTLNITKISGSYYQRITRDKDLIADILPPPQFIIEPYLIMHQMLDETDKAKLEQLAAKATELRDEYEARHEFWAGTLPEGKTREELIVASYRPAEEFFEIIDKQVMPAILRGDKENAHTLIRDLLTPKYEDHRLAIENVVKTAADAILREERESAVIVKRRLILLVLLGMGIIGLALLHRQSEEKLRHASQYARRLIEASLDPLVTIDPEGRISDVNAATEQATGYARSELIGTDFSNYFTEPEKARAGYQQVFNQGFVRDYELEIRNRNGEIAPVLYNASVYRDDTGKVIGAFAAARDITELKRAEEARTRLAAIVESSDDAIISKDLDGTITSWNAGAERVYGYSAAEALGRHISMLTPPNQQDEISLFMRRIGEEIRVEHYETQRVRKDGRTIDVSLTLSPVRNRRGEINGASTIARDISAQKRAEEALRQSEAYLAEAQRLSHTGSWALDVASGKYIYSSEETSRIYGFDPQDGPPSEEAVFQRIHPEDRDRWKANREKSLREKVDIFDEYRIVLPDGTVKDIHAIRHPVLNSAGDVVQLIGTSIDITERKRAEEALRQSEAYLAESQRLTHTGSWAVDLVSDNYIYASEEDLRIFGFDPQEPLPTREEVFRLIHPEDRDRVEESFQETFREKIDTSCEYRIVLPDGTVKHIHVIRHPVLNSSGEIIRLIGTSMDVTERKLAEDALRRSEAYLTEAQRLSHTGSWALDVASGKYDYWSEETFRIYEFDPQEGLPTKEAVYRRIYPEDWNRAEEGFQKSICEKVDTLDEFRSVLPSGTVKHIQLIRHPILNDAGDVVQLVGTTMDITERKRAEESLRCLNRQLRAIGNCNQTLLRATDEQSLLEEICRIVCEEAGYRMAWVGYAEHDEAKSVRPVAWTGAEDGYLATANITWADTERGRGPAGTAIRNGESCYIQDYATDPRFAPWRESALERGYHSGIVLPLKDEHAKAFGCLCIYSAERNAFTSEEIWLLEELAADLAFGIVTLRSRAARKRAEQEVALLSFALDKIREGAFLIDDSGRFRYVNEEGCRVLGYTRAELLGLGVSDIDPEFPAERWSDHWRDLKAQRSLSFESRHRTRDSHIFPVEISANYFEYGGRAYNLALARDITERKRAEEALRQSEAYLTEAQRLSHTGSWALDVTTGKYVYWSEEVFRIFGFDPQEGLGTLEEISRRFHPEDLNRWKESFERSLCEKVDTFNECRFVLPDGTVKHIHLIRHPVLNDAGDVVQLVGTSMDITERKQAEEALRASEHKYRELVENANSIILRWNSRGDITFLNEFGQKFFGYQEDEILGRNVVGTITPEIESTGRDLRSLMAKISENPTVFEQNINENMLRDGSRVWIAWTNKIAFDAEGELIEVLSIGSDITERKCAEEALLRSEAYLAEAQRLTHTGSWALDLAGGKYIYLSEESFRIWGLDPQGPLPTREAIFRQILPEDWKGVEESFQRTIREKVDTTCEYTVTMSDGTMKHIRTIRHPVLNDAGDVVQLVGTSMDITELKRAEESLRLAGVYNRSLIEASLDPLVTIDPEGRITDVNAATEHVTGYNRSELIGTHFSDYFTKPEKARSVYRKVFSEGLVRDYELNICHRDSRITPVLCNASIYRDEAGKVIGIFVAARDITERKQAQEALQKLLAELELRVKDRTKALSEANQSLQAVNKELDSFTYSVAHDLRAPLRAIDGFSMMVLKDYDDKLDDEGRRKLSVIRSNTRQMGKLIDDLLTFSRMGRKEMVTASLDMEAIVRSVWRELTQLNPGRRIQFSVQRLPQGMGDQTLIKEVVINLLSNAIKFTKYRENAVVEVGAWPGKETNVYFVKDNGAGFDMQYHDKLFGVFQRLHSADEFEGTGVGLAIVERIIGRHGGRVWAEGKEGEGATLYFTLARKGDG